MDVMLHPCRPADTASQLCFSTSKVSLTLPALNTQETTTLARVKATLFHLQRPTALPGADAPSFRHGNCENSLNIERVRERDLIKEMRKQPGSHFAVSTQVLACFVFPSTKNKEGTWLENPNVFTLSVKSGLIQVKWSFAALPARSDGGSAF